MYPHSILTILAHFLVSSGHARATRATSDIKGCFEKSSLSHQFHALPLEKRIAAALAESSRARAAKLLPITISIVRNGTVRLFVLVMYIFCKFATCLL